MRFILLLIISGVAAFAIGYASAVALAVGSEGGEPTRLQKFDGENAVSLRMRLGTTSRVDNQDVRMPDGSILVGARGPEEVGEAIMVAADGGIVAGVWTKEEGGYFTVTPK